VAGNPGAAPVVPGLFVKTNTKALFRALRPSFRISLPALASSALHPTCAAKKKARFSAGPWFPPLRMLEDQLRGKLQLTR
jgi:hypothetical protein